MVISAFEDASPSVLGWNRTL